MIPENPEEPWAEWSIEIEPAQIPKPPQERALRRVERIVVILQYRERVVICARTIG